MKGLMPEDIGWTLIFMVVIAALAIIGVFMFIKVAFFGEQLSYTVQFLSVESRPYTLAEVMAHTKIDDRTILEQSIESMTAGSLEGASATDFPGNLKSFVNAFGLRNYYVSVGNGNEIMRIESTEFKCGANKEGWCTHRRIAGENCDVGRIEIDGNGDCNLLQVCCKYDPAAYATISQKSVLNCGNERGVCSEGRKLTTWIGVLPPLPIRTGPFCDTGQIYFGKPAECRNANRGETRICCAPKTEEIQVASGTLSRATVPLLYKIQVYGTLEVSAK